MDVHDTGPALAACEMRVMAVLSGVLAAVPVVLLLCHAPAAAEDVAGERLISTS